MMNTVNKVASREIVLKSMVDIQVGYQARGRVQEVPGGRFAMLGPADFADGVILPRGMKRFEPEINPERYLVRQGDVLVQARGQGHAAVLVNEPLDSTVASNAFYRLRVKDPGALLPAYLCWWINQPRVQAAFRRDQGLSTVSFLSKSTLAQAPLLVPPVEVQERIAAVLELQARERALQATLNSKKKKLINAVLRRAVNEHGG